MVQFTTPELDKNFKLTVEGGDAQDLMVDHATRNGKYVKDQIARLIWAKHELPMYRGTIVDEVPFQLRIDQMLFDYRSYKVVAVYRFISSI